MQSDEDCLMSQAYNVSEAGWMEKWRSKDLGVAVLHHN